MSRDAFSVLVHLRESNKYVKLSDSIRIIAAEGVRTSRARVDFPNMSREVRKPSVEKPSVPVTEYQCPWLKESFISENSKRSGKYLKISLFVSVICQWFIININQALDIRLSRTTACDWKIEHSLWKFATGFSNSENCTYSFG